MNRRLWLQWLSASALPVGTVAQAHHGWSSFDLDRPIYLEGRASKVKWQNPHAELMLELTRPLRIPSDLTSRHLPSQTAQVDGANLLNRAVLPRRTDTTWEVELAPLTRMDAWKIPAVKPGQALAVLGFTFKEEKGSPILRAEFLWLEGHAYGLRSSPA